MTSCLVRPFSCGAQWADWQESNCARCAKGGSPDAVLDDVTCPVERALAEGPFRGWVPRGIAERSGWSEQQTRYVWPCTEWVPSAEVVAAHEEREGSE